MNTKTSLSRFRFGPGVLVTAAFIGPGTVTASTLAGANFGHTLLWALLFATLATMILQEMSARLGAVGQRGLGETLASELSNSALKWPLIALVLVALYGGNAAYEAGNLAGATLGLGAVLGESKSVTKIGTVCLSLLSGLVLVTSRYRTIERVLVGLVILMSLAFALTFFLVRPDLISMLIGMFKPTIPDGALLTVIALIGTTVVPYNLFLHAAVSKQRWHGHTDLSVMRTDTVLSIGLGGLITILIVSTAATSIYANALQVNNAADMAVQLQPLFGNSAKVLLGFGLFAAGLSSAITAPLATAFAVTELLSIKDPNKRIFKAIALSVLIIGTLLALTGIKPITLILMAQFANGLTLPIIAAFLLWAMNRRRVLGDQVNGLLANLCGAVVIVVTAVLGLRLIGRALGFAW